MPPLASEQAKRFRQAFDVGARHRAWPELLIAGAVTAAVFAAAVVSMTSVLPSVRSHSDLDADRSRTQVTFLERPRPIPQRPAPAPRPPRAIPRAPSPVEAPPVRAAAPPVTTQPVDTGRIALRARLTDIAPPSPVASPAPSPTAPTVGRGAPDAPAGLTMSSRAARNFATMTSRDSAFAVWAQDAHDLARWQTMSAATAGDIAQSQREAKQLAQRVATAGNSGDVHVMSGNGKDGVGAAGGGGLGGSVGSAAVFARTVARATRARLDHRRRRPRRTGRFGRAHRRKTRLHPRRFDPCRLDARRLHPQTRPVTETVGRPRDWRRPRFVSAVWRRLQNSLVGSIKSLQSWR